MARIARVVLPGIPHHVTQRGNRRQTVFFGDADYAHYHNLITAGCRNAKTHCLAYCLMPNHVHLVLTPTDAEGLRAALAEAHRRYARYINARYGWRGHLWQERFYSCPMSETHLAAAVRYVELNPVRAGLVGQAGEWKWSSARIHLRGGGDALVKTGPLLGWFPDWGSYLGECDPVDAERIRLHSRTGRPLGDDAFIRSAETLTHRALMRKRPGRKTGDRVGGGKS